VTAVTKLLHPFKWEHLVVPLVPSSLARDLLEYPAPFIIGLAAEDEGNLELLNALPDDVTLVDLDVGRVILAPSIAFGDDPSISDFGQNRRSKALALRSQVLYLAQGLGVVFGTRLRRQAWCGDSPSISLSQQDSKNETASFGKLQEICRIILEELVAGTEACCHWIEESQSPDAPLFQTDVERTVLFDEDRFFQIKNLRAMRKYTPLFADSPGVGEFALGLDDFDLVLECFLRCQSMSSYVSTRSKNFHGIFLALHNRLVKYSSSLEQFLKNLLFAAIGFLQEFWLVSKNSTATGSLYYYHVGGVDLCAGICFDQRKQLGKFGKLPRVFKHRLDRSW
jgi:hypothetical protein